MLLCVCSAELVLACNEELARACGVKSSGVRVCTVCARVCEMNRLCCNSCQDKFSWRIVEVDVV